MRLNKYLSDAGFCSRRRADRLAEEGRVTVNGRKAPVGAQVEENDVVCVDAGELYVLRKKGKRIMWWII